MMTIKLQVRYYMLKNKLIKEYLLPVRIVAKSDNVQNAEALLVNEEEQVSFFQPNFLSCKGKGYIILDYGKELVGGVRILTTMNPVIGVHRKIRLRFGESVEETCVNVGEKGAINEHSARDFEVLLPFFSDQEWGQTGFRFVRIDFLDEAQEYQLSNVYAAFTHRDLQYKGDFSCSDPLVNKIYDVARYTVFLNMQNQLWDGIKRDRLVWMGDMHPEVVAITDIFGESDCVEEALDFSVAKTPLPGWFSGMPSYSMWYILVLVEYYQKVKKPDYVRKHLPYVNGVLDLFDKCVTEEGVVDYGRTIGGDPFLDWPTKATSDCEPGTRYLYIYTLKRLREFYQEIGEEVNPVCVRLLQRLEKVKYADVAKKQTIAFGYLAGQIDKEKTALRLTKGGAKGLSTFMSYFILKAMAETKDVATAVEAMKEYYNGMLSCGATTFWEDFDLDWLENSGRIDEFTPEGKRDIHGDFGDFCYVGFRHSLCHGWACGPVHFLTEKVLGVEVTKAGCEELTITPRLGNLTWCKGKFPTPYGIVEIEHKKVGDRVETKVKAPAQVKVTVCE